MDSDADRLAMIKSLGGVSVRVRGQSFYAIFDNGYSEAIGMVESADPILRCRSSDIDRLQVVKGNLLEVSAEQYRVDRLEPDGTGMSIVQLSK